MSNTKKLCESPTYHDHVPIIVKMMEGIPSVTPYPMKVSLPLKRQKVLVLHREVVSPHEPWSSSPAIATFYTMLLCEICCQNLKKLL